jgi:hypothetical protein
MGAFYDSIPNDDIRSWILEQKMYWVATAPLSEDGHVNVSPKGSLIYYPNDESMRMIISLRPASFHNRK